MGCDAGERGIAIHALTHGDPEQEGADRRQWSGHPKGDDPAELVDRAHVDGIAGHPKVGADLSLIHI